jgi:hypothetical protein
MKSEMIWHFCLLPNQLDLLRRGLRNPHFLFDKIAVCKRWYSYCADPLQLQGEISRAKYDPDTGRVHGPACMAMGNRRAVTLR